MKKKALLTIILFSFCMGRPLASVLKADDWYNKKHHNRFARMTYELIKDKYYFAAIPFAKEHLVRHKKLSRRFEKTLVRLILKTGTESFIDLNYNILKQGHSKALKLILGIKSFRDGHYQLAINNLSGLDKGHRFYSESLIIRASSHGLLGLHQKAATIYDECISVTQEKYDNVRHKKLKRYYGIIKESCAIHKARLQYAQGNYQAARASYQAIPKTSYRWPYILLENAWSHYYLEDYNRTLGLLVTYKSPLLTSYFLPEGEVLKAMSYMNLCLWDDALEVVNQYYNIYRPRSANLKKTIAKYSKGHDGYLKLLFNSQKEKLKNPFVGNLVTRVRKKVKFNLDLLALRSSQSEAKRMASLPETKFISLLKKELRRDIRKRKIKLNFMVKKSLYRFINQIHRFSSHLFNIKLEVMSMKRDLLYRNKKLVSARSRGDEKNIIRQKGQHFYSFNGSFWADELGDYSFGLKSNCEEVKSNYGGRR